MNVVRTILRGVGQTLITAGLVILLFVVYELYGTNFYTAQQQGELEDDLRKAWLRPAVANAEPARDVGAIGILHIPRLGDGFEKVIVEGVSRDDLKKGPGHYPGTAMPGQVGNMVVSGHRTTYGAPFNRIDEIRPDDALVVETRDQWLVYRMTEQEIVTPDAIEVTYPVPGQAGVKPTRRLLTLTTCHPKYSAKQRLIVRAELEVARPKSAGPPPGLR